MAYYFTYSTPKGHESINLSKSKYFPFTTTKYKKENAYTLQEIDQFTMLFNNEKELRKALLEDELVPMEYVLRPLSTRFLHKNQYNRVMYDFLYQKDMEYVANPTKLVAFIMDKYYHNDLRFIQKLASHFSKTHECSTTAPEVARLAEASIHAGYKYQSLDEIDQNGDRMVARLVKLLILKHYEHFNGIIEYRNEVNYKNLHDLIAFINHYYEFDKQKNPILLEDILPQSKQTTINNTVQVKKKVKKIKEEIEGQISFEDML